MSETPSIEEMLSELMVQVIELAKHVATLGAR